MRRGLKTPPPLTLPIYKSFSMLMLSESDWIQYNNLHVLILKTRDIKSSDATGDGTGYSLTVKKNYESYAQKLKDMAKENPDHGEGGKGSKGHRKRLFAYSFAIMDLETRLYIAPGSYMKSERNAYDRAMDLLLFVGVDMDSIRLDRYYSSPSYMNKLGNTKVFVIPKRNATLNGSQKWKDTMKEFVENTMNYLEQYHQRSNSES
jgi:transposase